MIYLSSGSCLENREYCRRDLSRWLRGTLYPQKLAITSSTSGGRSVGVVRSQTQTMEFFFIRKMYRTVQQNIGMQLSLFVVTYITNNIAYCTESDVK
jgi:hypothetical protein